MTVIAIVSVTALPSFDDFRARLRDDGQLEFEATRALAPGEGLAWVEMARGLLVHTWTFRNDASGYGFKDPQAEMAYYMKLGVDGVFTDFPATGVAALDSLR